MTAPTCSPVDFLRVLLGPRPSSDARLRGATHMPPSTGDGKGEWKERSASSVEALARGFVEKADEAETYARLAWFDGKGAKAENVAARRILSGDVDDKAMPGATAEERHRNGKTLVGTLPCPYILVDSGGGFHVYLLLPERDRVEAFEDVKDGRAHVARLGRALRLYLESQGHDLLKVPVSLDHTHGVERAWRVPPSWNMKSADGEKTLTADRSRWRRVRWANPNKALVPADLSFLVGYVQAAEDEEREAKAGKARPVSVNGAATSSPPSGVPFDLTLLPERLRSAWPLADKNPSEGDFTVACALVERGETDDVIGAAVRARRAALPKPEDRAKGERADYVARTVAKARASVSTGGADAVADSGLLALREGAEAREVEAALRRLARLLANVDALARETARARAVQAVERMGVSGPARLVDAALGGARPPEATTGQGAALVFADDVPAPDSQNGAALFDDLAALYRKHVVLPPHGDVACALWTIHAYAVAAAAYSPRLAVTSAVKRSGKTRVLKTARGVVPRPLSTENASTSALFRTVEAKHPTLLIDEYDAFAEASEEHRGLLNAGYERGATFLRSEGDDHEPRAFDVFGPVAIAKIGAFPSTVADRSIVLPMRRRTRGEEAARLPRPDRFREACALLRQRLVRWTKDNLPALMDAAPAFPDALDDRAADLWEPLLAIADLAGGRWPDRARAAALALTGAREDDERGVQLLADVRAAFVAKGTDRLASKTLVEALVAVEDRPWATCGRNDKPLTPSHLAALLKPFVIVPRSVRLDDGTTPKGYLLEQFHDAFNRYLPATEAGTPSRNATPPQPSNLAASEPIPCRNKDSGVAAPNRPLSKQNQGLWRCGGAEAARGRGDETPAPREAGETQQETEEAFEAEERAAIQEDGALFDPTSSPRDARRLADEGGES